MNVRGTLDVTGQIVSAMKAEDSEPGVGITYPKFDAYNNNSQAIAQTTWTDIELDAENENTDTSVFQHSTVTNNEAVTVLKSGLYLIHVGIGWSLNTTGTRGLRLTINNAELGGGNNGRIHELLWDASTNTCRNTFTTFWPLNSGDVIRIQGWQDGTASLALQSATTLNHIRVVYLGQSV